MSISHLNLSGCSLGATSLIAIATVLQTNNNIITVDISNNMIPTTSLTQTLVNDIMTHFATTLQLNYGIKHLNFSKMGVSDWSLCDLLASALKLNQNLETLNLSRYFKLVYPFGRVSGR